jgi:hypothetical protein
VPAEPDALPESAPAPPPGVPPPAAPPVPGWPPVFSELEGASGIAGAGVALRSGSGTVLDPSLTLKYAHVA